MTVAIESLTLAQFGALGIDSPRTPYLGYVATRCGRLNTSKGATNKQLMSRTFHYARDNISALKLILGNFWTDTFNTLGGGIIEQGSGAAASVTASIEYPAGTFTQVTFGGQATGSIPDVGTIVSDFCTIAIPNGAKFWVRWWGNFPGANGIPYGGAQPMLLNGDDAMTFGVTAADQTMGGTVAQTSGVLLSPPIGILGMTTRPSFWLGMDSKCFGQFDTGDSTGDTGQLARSIGANYAYINAGSPGDTMASLTGANGVNRRSLLQYATHGISQGGINDLKGGSSAATLLASLATFIGQWGVARPLYATTLTPQTTSTDSWVTTANQTAGGATTNINSYNASLRAGVAGLAGVVDLSDIQSSARDSGLWNVLSGLQHTADGLHENGLGYRDIARSGRIVGVVGQPR